MHNSVLEVTMRDGNPDQVLTRAQHFEPEVLEVTMRDGNGVLELKSSAIEVSGF